MYTSLSILAILSYVISSASPAPVTIDPLLDTQWAKFKLDHNKWYGPEEDALRKHIWSGHKIDIDAHNLQTTMEWNSFYMKYNQFTDRTVQEIESHTKSTIEQEVTSTNVREYEMTSGELPESVDWRDQGWVTPVLNQYACASDWAIAADGMLEGQLMNRTGSLTPLSIQDLLDCSDDTNGCRGGTPDVALTNILNRVDGGVETASCKPYDAKKNLCVYNSTCSAATLRSIHTIPSGNEAALQHAVATFGPVAASIGLGSGFLSYSSGVYDNAACSKTLTRSVLIVGYGTEAGLDYWLVKNSFGAQWGDHGYIKMARNRDNQCGIASRAIVAYVA